MYEMRFVTPKIALYVPHIHFELEGKDIIIYNCYFVPLKYCS